MSDNHNHKSEVAHTLYRGELLAPMVRCSTVPLRALALQYGANACFTEEIIDQTLMHSQKVVRTLRSSSLCSTYLSHHNSNSNHNSNNSTKQRLSFNNHVVNSNSVIVVDWEKKMSDTIPMKMSARTLKKLDGLPPLVLRIDPQLECSTALYRSIIAHHNNSHRHNNNNNCNCDDSNEYDSNDDSNSRHPPQQSQPNNNNNHHHHHRLICQLGTADPDRALQAALTVHAHVGAIDINMGCPKRFSTHAGMGSALLKDPQRACSITRHLDSHLNNIPISAKIRLLDSTNRVSATVDFCCALIERGGVSALTIHGRTIHIADTQPADWQALRATCQILSHKFPHIPILVNGDFYTRSEFTSYVHDSGAAGVVLARPALFNTSLFLQPTPPPNINKNIASITSKKKEDHADADEDEYGYASPLLLDKYYVIQDYVRYAHRYQMHYKNTKYVIGEMLNVRRAPIHRVPHLLLMSSMTSSSSTSSSRRIHQPHQRRLPTIGETCACQSMDDLLKLWQVIQETATQKDHSSRKIQRISPSSSSPSSSLEDNDNDIAGDEKVDSNASGRHHHHHHHPPPTTLLPDTTLIKKSRQR